MNIKDFGYADINTGCMDDGIPARITAVHKERYELVSEHGYGFGRVKASNYYNGTESWPTVGDFVIIEYNDAGDSRIMRTLPRRSYFSRLDPSSGGHGEQAVAANFDYVFIMQSLNKDYNIRKLERYLTESWQSGAEPVVVLTKADLAEEIPEYVRKTSETAPGVRTVVVSAKTGLGMEELEEYLNPGKTIVFLGSSGVGKSSLVNALAKEEIMETGEIREDDSRGRHTTTHRELVMLKSGVMIIDTPGMRELGMWDVSEGLGQSFSDVEQYFAKCRFNNCRHQTEPGCAVREALESGELSESRWASYCKLKREAKFTDDKTAYYREMQKIGKAHSRKRRRNK